MSFHFHMESPASIDDQEFHLAKGMPTRPLIVTSCIHDKNKPLCASHPFGCKGENMVKVETMLQELELESTQEYSDVIEALKKIVERRKRNRPVQNKAPKFVDGDISEGNQPRTSYVFQQPSEVGQLKFNSAAEREAYIENKAIREVAEFAASIGMKPAPRTVIL